ncbi:hypothetical protein [Alcaligenes aquatilis]
MAQKTGLSTPTVNAALNAFERRHCTTI